MTSKGDSSEFDTVSVIVPTSNNARTIRACLESLERQTRRPDEIVVIDRGSTDGTQEIARQFARLLETDVVNRCRQSNVGAEAATGRYLFFVDADMIVTENVINEALAVSHSANIPTALVVPEIQFGSTFWARVRAFERTFYDVWWNEFPRWMSREVFWSVGPFDETMVGSEDWVFDERLRERQVSIERIKSPIRHDNGELHLFSLAARKAHYSASFTKFRSEFPRRASVTLSVRHRATLFLKRPLTLLRHPVLTAGLMILGITEYFALRGWYHGTNPFADEKPVEALGSSEAM